MAAFKLNLAIDQGATFRKTVTWKAGEPAAPVDLTGCTARMHVRGAVGASAVLLSLATEGNGISLGGTAGTVSLELTAAQTSAIPWGSAVYDLEVVFADASVRRLLSGKIKVSPEITR